MPKLPVNIYLCMQLRQNGDQRLRDFFYSGAPLCGKAVALSSQQLYCTRQYDFVTVGYAWNVEFQEINVTMLN